MGQYRAVRAFSAPVDVFDIELLPIFRRMRNDGEQNVSAQLRAALFRLFAPSELFDHVAQRFVTELFVHRQKAFERLLIFLFGQEPFRQGERVRNKDAALCAAHDVDGYARNRHFFDIAVNRPNGYVVLFRKISGFHLSAR